jgi:hypothetical protein
MTCSSQRIGMLPLQLLVALSVTWAFQPFAIATPVIVDATQWGGKVIIKGSGFTPRTDIVKFNGAAGTITDGTATILEVDLPDKATPGTITVTDAAGVTAVSAKPYSFTAVTITRIDPTTGSPGTKVFITGKNFDPVAANNIIVINGTGVPAEQGNTTLLAVTTPKGATSGPISWKHATNGAVAAYPGIFTIGNPPSITAMVPTQGPKGLLIELQGQNLGEPGTPPEVLFKDKAKAEVTKVTPTAVQVEVPYQAITGPITLSTQYGQATSSTDFNVTGPVLIFEPTSGPSGSTVIISGARFDQSGNKVTFNGIDAEVLRQTTSRILVKVPDIAQSGVISVTTSEGSLVSSAPFMVSSRRALHLYGGTTVNFFSKSSDGTAAQSQPLVGLLGVHQIPSPAPFGSEGDGIMQFGGDISYRGVAAEQLLSGGGSPNAQSLAAANSIGLFLNAYYSVYKGDKFTIGPSGMYGYEFLTSDNFSHDAQYSNGIYLRFQDHKDPLFYGQIGYGNTAYLNPNRLLIELSAPLLTTLLGDSKQPNSFFSKDFTDFYFFVGANINTDHRKDDSFIFGIKGVLSASKIFSMLNPNKTTVDKTQADATAKPAAK